METLQSLEECYMNQCMWMADIGMEERDANTEVDNQKITDKIATLTEEDRELIDELLNG